MPDSVNKKKPFFSVIIPTYNRSALLKRAIESVLNQNVRDFEIIVVDDASTDDTRQIVQKLEDKRIQYYKNKKNKHKGATRNVGIQMARGEYICFLDDDDFYLKDHLSVFKKEIINLGYPVAMFYTMPVSWSEESGRYTQRVLPPFNYSNPIAYLFYHKHGVPTPRVCVKKEILEKHLFNEKIRIGQDTELFLRIAAEYPVLPIQAFTAVQIRHSDNSGNLKNNTGLQRLAGYQYIFNNKNVARHIPWKLKREMMAYCYLRMTDHYAFTGNRWKTLRSSLIAFYYAPWDDQWKNKSAYIVYSIIGGRFFKRIRASLSK